VLYCYHHTFTTTAGQSHFWNLYSYSFLLVLSGFKRPAYRFDVSSYFRKLFSSPCPFCLWLHCLKLATAMMAQVAFPLPSVLNVAPSGGRGEMIAVGPFKTFNLKSFKPHPFPNLFAFTYQGTLNQITAENFVSMYLGSISFTTTFLRSFDLELTIIKLTAGGYKECFR